MLSYFKNSRSQLDKTKTAFTACATLAFLATLTAVGAGVAILMNIVFY
ncbi:MAG: hypothetical protein PV340_02625 [Wolbachia sp.]|nr:hypothetical protein [Wolbachia sp.]MDD9336787.1 hypothetical protein [Wolbachia sp.]